MMPGIVLELQREALDKSIRVSDLLRKAFLVARKLKVSGIESWIMSELNGYPDTDAGSFPKYRWLKGEIKSFNPVNKMWLPIMFTESVAGVHNALTNRPCNGSIAEIENLISKGKDGKLVMPYSSEIQAKITKAANLISPPFLIVQESQLYGIVDAIRTTILDWALKLEESGITGENLSFSDEDRKTASHITFNIGAMSNSQIQAETFQSQQVLTNRSFDSKAILDFIENARKSISELHLDETDKDEFIGELNTLDAQAKSPKPKNKIIQESFRTIRSILEGAAGKITADSLMTIVKNIFM